MRAQACRVTGAASSPRSERLLESLLIDFIAHLRSQKTQFPTIARATVLPAPKEADNLGNLAGNVVETGCYFWNG
jgi:hypothetical protein